MLKFVKTPYGMKMHGEFINDSFIRRINWNAVRWSSKSFRVNTQIFSDLKEYKTKYLKFKVSKANGENQIFRITVEKAFSVGKITRNEDNEESLNIPISEFEMMDILQGQRDGYRNNVGCEFGVKTIHDSDQIQKPQQNENKKVLQQNLF